MPYCMILYSIVDTTYTYMTAIRFLARSVQNDTNNENDNNNITNNNEAICLFSGKRGGSKEKNGDE